MEEFYKAGAECVRYFHTYVKVFANKNLAMSIKSTNYSIHFKRNSTKRNERVTQSFYFS